MEIEVIEPQRAPLHFPVDLDGAPTEVAEVVQAIKKVAERVLYHWDDFPIVLPPPLTVITTESDGNKKSKPLIVRDLFVAPTFEELNIVSLDAKGDPQPLTKKQLQNVKENGTFEVESMNFPGQVHKWQLSQLLQKGVHNIHDTLLQDIALSVHLIVVTARNRLISDFFSVSQSVRAFIHGLAILLDAFIGVPSLSAKNLEIRIQEERSKYLVAELTVRPNFEDDIDNLCQFVKHQIRKQTVEKYLFENEKAPPLPYLFQTPKGHEIDLRLFNKEIIRKALPVIASILEKESRGWFLPFREKVIADLKNKKISEEELERLANILILDEYLRRVFAAILSHPQIQELGPGIGSLLVEQAQAVILMHRAVENMHRRLKETLAQLKRCLEDLYPVLSRVKPWVQEKLKIAEEDFILDHRWDAHEEALALCRQSHLEQTSYFLQRDLSFMREREPVLKQELGRVRNPNRSFHWRTQIWSPHHWNVRKVFQGESEIVPTVISRTSSSLAQPRSDPNQPVYLVEKQRMHTTTTRIPFWRWINYCYRTYSWMWNAMFIFGIIIPWCSPVSLRALFCIRPFIPDLEINQIDGTLYPRKSSLTHTLCSRLLLLWRHISKSRTEFESRPDTGFIGKGFSRHLNRLWNYFIKGALGTLLIVFFFPLICFSVSFLSLCVAAFAAVWVPAVTLVFHLVMIFVYDFDSPGLPRNKVCMVVEALLWHISVLGVLQPILALLVALVICPIASLIVFLAAMIRCCCRLIWDVAMFHFLIKRRGRVPSSDSWLVKRIAGPGLSNEHFFQIAPEQALAAFEAKLETEELNAFREEVERIILLPQQIYREFVAQCFHPFSATLYKEGVYREVEKEAQELLAALRDQVDRRKKELQTGLSVNVRSKVKLTASDLQPTLHVATVVLQRFFPIHVLKRLQIKEEDFWDKKGLSYRDWPGFAAQLFTEVFSIDILTPLEDSDTRYRLEAHGVNLSRYSEMLQSVALQPNVDFSSVIHIPKGKIHVHSPYLDLNTFNPVNNTVSTVKKKETKNSLLNYKQQLYPWKKKLKHTHPEKILIPLPLPHPVQIAIIIFNRENEDPIPIETDLCQDILKAIADGSKSSAILMYEYEDSPADGQSVATTADEYRAVTSDLETMASEDRFSHSSLSRSQQLSTGDSIAVNLASTEDVTLEPEDQKVTYSHSSYSTTV
ncbi:uncharacterized protein LOC129983778 [Argiope bruennichi]|uniref:uncharacterized protein LOC129983778 n=1 Tax=Argiope bruennichi TaxID=94029 RepID=UPI0024947D3A|nr:uncharacterized protein LOC129983778 [Argiope bruennichi]